MKIEIQKPDKEEIEKRGISSWPIWEKAVSQFDWYYDSVEECYLLEGKVDGLVKSPKTENSYL